MDINNYSYTPHILDEAPQETHKDKYWYWYDRRTICLDLVYMIPGYAAAPLEVKNWIYDKINTQLSKLI